MNKLDNKFRQEVDSNFKEIDYVSKKLGFRIFIITLIILIIGAIGGYGYKIESEITVSQTKLDKRLCEDWSIPAGY